MNNNFRLNLLVSIGGIIVSFILFGVALYWLAKNISADAQKVIENRAIINKQTHSIAALAKLKAVAAQADTYSARMQELLPSQDELLDFPKWLEDRSKTYQLSLRFSFEGTTIMPNPAEAAPGAVIFSMDVSGPYDNLKRFFKELEMTSPRFLANIDKLDVTSPDNTKYRAVLEGRVFFK